MSFLLLDWRSLQPVLSVPRGRAAEAEERAGSLFTEPHGVGSVLSGVSATVAAVLLPGKPKLIGWRGVISCRFAGSHPVLRIPDYWIIG